MSVSPRLPPLPAPPVILDFDASVRPVADDELRIPLQSLRESIGFGCTRRAFRELEAFLRARLPEEPGCVFLGSGDYHHVTAILLARPAFTRASPGEPEMPGAPGAPGALPDGPADGPIDLVVCDNHPDNMRYPLGIHCGSWVRHASAMAHIRHVHVVGICSDDITLRHAWENCLTPLLRKKLVYWSIGKKAGWLDSIGLASQQRCFPSPDAFVQAFLPTLAASGRIYLSLDKDVLSPEIVTTNWDQGMFTETHLERIIAGCAGKLAGADICGDISGGRYRNWFKRLLSRMDGQSPVDPAMLSEWRQEHQVLNVKLLSWINRAMQGQPGR